MRVRINKNKSSMRVIVGVENLGKNTRKAIAEGFERMGAGLVRTLQNSILNEPKFGREYVASGPKGAKRLSRPSKNREANYQASASKQTPALLNGEYFEGAYYKPNGANGLEFGDTAEHAEYLELGTDKMKPRPGLGNAITSSLRNSRRYLEESLDKGIKP